MVNGEHILGAGRDGPSRPEVLMFTDKELCRLLDALVAARTMKPWLDGWRDATEGEWEALFAKVEDLAVAPWGETVAAAVAAAAAPETMVGWA